MAYQAPFRLAADARRQADIRVMHDPLLPTLPPDLQAIHRDRVRNSPLYARIAEIGMFFGDTRTLGKQGVAVIREAMANSSDDEVAHHGRLKWE